MQSSWVHGLYFAQSLDIPGRIDDFMRERVREFRNNSPIITCEGKCSEDGVAWTQHAIVSETWDKSEAAYRQIYRCCQCQTRRTFGLCGSRQTLVGEGSNN